MPTKKKTEEERVNKKVLFIHISKCGGASICKAPFILVHGSPEHSPKIPVRDYRLILSFAIVRNPYTRFTSAVFNHGYTTPEKFEEWTTTTFLNEFKNNTKNFMRNWQELIPQYKYIYHNGKRDVNYVGKFEDLETHWDNVCGFVGEEFKLPHLNKNKFPDHEKYHTEKTRKVVRDVYAKDFELFGYKK